MPIDPAVTDFFRSYQHRYEREWQIMEPADSAYELAQMYAVRPPQLTRIDVRSAFRELNVRHPVPQVYEDFITFASYDGLDACGWIDFAPTTNAPRWLDRIRAIKGVMSTADSFPFAQDEMTGAVFFLDWKNEFTEPQISLIDQVDTVVSGVFGSFALALSLLSKVLLSDDFLQLNRGSRPSPEQVQLLSRVLASDPDGFAKVGWPMWYKRAFLWP